jgi:hypothetical protein
MTHTPGPWEAGRADMKSEVNSYFGKWVYAGERFIAATTSQDIESWDEVMANANLIAAAPEMLETLKTVMDTECFDLHCLSGANRLDQLCSMHKKVLDAIAKAEGKV